MMKNLLIFIHPTDKRPLELESGNDNIAVCVYGKNRMNQVLVSDTLKGLFCKYNIIPEKSGVEKTI